VVNTTYQPLYPRKWNGTRGAGGTVDSRAGLNRCGKSRLLWDSIPGSSIPLYWLSYAGPSCFMYSTYGIICRIWGSLSDVAEKKSLFWGYYTVLNGKWLLTFGSNCSVNMSGR
jgi:hypothetical protein